MGTYIIKSSRLMKLLLLLILTGIMAFNNFSVSRAAAPADNRVNEGANPADRVLTAVSEDGLVTMKVTTALGGLIKYGHLAELHVTIANRGKQDINGTVIMPFDQGNRFRGNSQADVKVPAGDERTLKLTVSSDKWIQPGASLYFRYEKGLITVGTPFRGEAGGVAVGLIAPGDGSDAYVSGLRTVLGEQQVKSLTVDDLSDNPAVWGNLDYLVLDGAAENMFSEEQISALKQWLAQGGRLILMPGTDGHLALPDLSPVILTGGRTAVTLDGLAGYLDELKSDNQEKTQVRRQVPGEVSVPEAKVAGGGKAIVAMNGVPLLATMAYGQGHAVYFGIRPEALPISWWVESPSVWQGIVKVAGMSLVEMKTPDTLDMKGNALADASRYFPQVKVPSVALVGGIFFLYVLIVAPLFYWLFRRMRKQEWLWGVIPLSAVVVTVLIYAGGMMARGGGSIGSMVNWIEITSPQTAQVASAASLLANRHGDLTVEGKDVNWMSALRDYSSSGGTDGAINRQPGDDGYQVTFQDVPYWSPRQVFALSYREDLGQFAAQLAEDQGLLTGEIVNRMPFDLQQVWLVKGDKAIDLGTLPAGEKAVVQQSIDAIGQAPWIDYSRFVKQSEQGPRLADVLNRLEINRLASFSGGDAEVNKAEKQWQIIGWTDQSVADWLTLKDKSIKIDQLSVIAQLVNVSVAGQEEAQNK